MTEQTTAVAERQGDPIISALGQFSGALQAHLPTKVDRDRFVRIVQQAYQRTPRLQECTLDSIASAAVEAAELGLEPSGAVGGAHLVPYNVNVGTKERPRWEKHAQLIIDYRGLVELARRSDKIEDVYAEVVREADHFRVIGGSEPRIEHIPNLAAPVTPNPDHAENPMTHVYAVAVFRSGYRRSVVMSKAEVDAIRTRARDNNTGPWATDYLQMALKTVLRRLCKTLPLPKTVHQALEVEDARERQLAATVEPMPTVAHAALGERLQQQRLATEGTDQPGQAATVTEAAPQPDGGGGAQAAPAPAPQPEAAASPPGGEPQAPVQEGLGIDGAEPSCPHPSDNYVVSADRSQVACGLCGEVLTNEPAAVPHVTAAGEAVPSGQPAGDVAPPPASTGTPLDALQAAPSKPTFLAYASHAIAREATELAHLSKDDWQQVVAALGPAWPDLYRRLPTVVKANARGNGMAPQRKEAA